MSPFVSFDKGAHWLKIRWLLKGETSVVVKAKLSIQRVTYKFPPIRLHSGFNAGCHLFFSYLIAPLFSWNYQTGSVVNLFVKYLFTFEDGESICDFFSRPKMEWIVPRGNVSILGQQLKSIKNHTKFLKYNSRTRISFIVFAVGFTQLFPHFFFK